MFVKIIKLSVILTFLSGCGIFAPVPVPEINNYQILKSNYQIPKCSDKNQLKTLHIAQMRAEAPYDTTKMFYSKAEYQLDAYSYNQWVAFPAEMMDNLLLQSISAACIYKNVVNSEIMSTSDYTLNTRLLELKQILNGTDAQFNLIVLAQLMDNVSDKAIKTKVFKIAVKSDPNPKAYVVSANQAAVQFADQLLAWLR